MLKVNSYSKLGTKLTPISLPKEWEEKSNPSLLSQAVRVYIDRSHIGLRSTKTRSEVNRTTKKLYKQKGTGGARHGSRKAPIFVGGGVAFGPRPVKRILTLPTQMKRKGVAVAMREAVKEDKVIAADLSFKKTKEAQIFLNKITKNKNTQITFIIKKENLKVQKTLRNIKNTKIIVFPGMNALDIFIAGLVVFDKEIFKK